MRRSILMYLAIAIALIASTRVAVNAWQGNPARAAIREDDVNGGDVNQEAGDTKQAETPGGKNASARRAVNVDFREAYKPTPVTRAVDRGLAYLAAQQLEDGSWQSTYYGKNTGVSSLALLAFLARGHEPGRGEYGQLLDRGVAWVLASANGGVLHRGAVQDYAVMYSHGIAALLLGQVVGMIDTTRPEFESLYRVHSRSIQIILRAQENSKNARDAGGWRYQIDARDSDISVTGWQLLALRAAQDCGLDVSKSAIDRAVGYIRRACMDSGGFRYTSFGNETTLGRTGTGVLALQICGETSSPEVLAGGDWMLHHPLSQDDSWFYYGAYYSAHAMYQLGGNYWKSWQPISEALLVGQQREDGSWPLPSRTPQEAEAGPVYTTSLAILALSVEFRYLPIYQR